MLDIKFEVGGRTVRAGDLGDAIDDLLFKAVADSLHEQLSGVRDPETGEFPVVAVRGNDLSNLSLEISGSDRVVELAKQRLGVSNDTDEEIAEHPVKKMKVFLSHASEDKPLARRIAEQLALNGIDTFFDEWEIRPGDSIRQKIDQGIEECTHFIVLATETSIEKEWVKTEIDGVYRRKIEGQCRLIPLRHKLDPRRLPASLGGLHAPALDDFETDIKSLVDDIYDISRKPPLGKAPSAITQRISESQLGLSPAAEALVRLCMAETKDGDSFDPQLDEETIAEKTGLNKDDMLDAIEELEALGLIRRHRHLGDGGIGRVSSEAALFVKFDKHFNDWDPEQDALQIAVALQNEVVSGNAEAIAKHFGWPPRRANPAFTYLAERCLVDAHQHLGTHPWRYSWIMKTAATRRFVRDRS